jgi:hypothetical protein
VFGESVSKEGVFGYGDTGVRGEGNLIGVHAISATEIGLYAQSDPFLGQKGPPGVAAGIFVGPVMVAGPFAVFSSAKSVAVKDSRGEFRQLFCMESPESWFEDFGEAALIKGKAQVKLDPLFASLVKTKGYHVFLSPYGDCNGLYVSARGATGFSVHERQRGGSNIDFSYRIVARRKDVAAERLPKIDAPRPPCSKLFAPSHVRAVRRGAAKVFALVSLNGMIKSQRGLGVVRAHELPRGPAATPLLHNLAAPPIRAGVDLLAGLAP